MAKRKTGQLDLIDLVNEATAQPAQLAVGSVVEVDGEQWTVTYIGGSDKGLTYCWLAQQGERSIGRWLKP